MNVATYFYYASIFIVHENVCELSTFGTIFLLYYKSGLCPSFVHNRIFYEHLAIDACFGWLLSMFVDALVRG